MGRFFQLTHNFLDKTLTVQYNEDSERGVLLTQYLSFLLEIDLFLRVMERL